MVGRFWATTNLKATAVRSKVRVTPRRDCGSAGSIENADRLKLEIKNCK